MASDVIDSTGFRDPHVFPFIVKGWKPGVQMFDSVVVYESRRNKLEAEQTAERFLAMGYSAFIFEVKALEAVVTATAVEG